MSDDYVRPTPTRPRSATDLTKLQIAAYAGILISGFFLLLATVALLVQVNNAIEETEQNRRITCLNRYYSNEPYAPECDQYIPDAPPPVEPRRTP